MIKRIIINLIAIIITIIVMIFGYYMIIDIETKIPQKANESCDIETKEFMSRKIFIIKPKTEQLSKKVILYFHGGAYVAEATTLHWDFLEKLANDTKSTIVMPDYPLTPKYTYKDVFNMVEPLYKEIISKVDVKNLVMMGDSAGGGITLALAEKISQNNIQLPSKTILISPFGLRLAAAVPIHKSYADFLPATCPERCARPRRWPCRRWRRMGFGRTAALLVLRRSRRRNFYASCFQRRKWRRLWAYP